MCYYEMQKEEVTYVVYFVWIQISELYYIHLVYARDIDNQHYLLKCLDATLPAGREDRELTWGDYKKFIRHPTYGRPAGCCRTITSLREAKQYLAYCKEI